MSQLKEQAMVEKGEEDEMIKLLHESMAPLSIFGHVNWGLNLATRTAAGAKALVDHIDWTSKVMEERAKVSEIITSGSLKSADCWQTTPKENDVFSWLLDPNATKVSPELNADSRLLVVAGR
jgi:hypothetical protein